MTDTLQALEKLLKTDRDIDTKTEEFKGEPTSPLYWKQPKLSKKPIFIYLVTLQEQLPSNRYPQGYVRADWIPVKMLDLRRFKEAIGSSGMHSHFVREMSNLWSTSSRTVHLERHD